MQKEKEREKKKKHLSSGSGTRSFNIALNTTLAYIYNYTSGIWCFFPGEYKLIIDKWYSYPSYLYYMLVISDCPIMIDKLQLGFKNL